MNTLARLVAERLRLVWAGALCLILLAAWGAGEVVRQQREAQRFEQLATQAGRLGSELMAQTLSSNLMGSMAMLGLIHEDIKKEVQGAWPVNSAKTLKVFESIGRAAAADGIFIVTAEGVIASSWDNSGKPSTGLNVKFRPYFQMAMQGKNNIYAAVSLARGERSLYFAAPVFAEAAFGKAVIGVVVARTALHTIDNLLLDKSDHALLLSPQGVVFASARREWLGALAGEASPERLQAIRALKQFGNLFEKKTPDILPFAVREGVQEFAGRRHFGVQARMNWNDPFGEWQVALLEDLERSVPLSERLGVMSGAAVFLLAVTALLLTVLKSHHVQVVASRQLDALARRQQASAERRAALSRAALSLQQAKDLAALGHAYLVALHGLLHIQQGVVYAASASGQLQLIGSYAVAAAPPPLLRQGEGLLGQCAVEKRLLRLDAPTDGQWRLRSGLGSCPPHCLLLAPILLNDALAGVTELALLNELDAEAEETLAEMNKLLALNIEILKRSQGGAAP